MSITMRCNEKIILKINTRGFDGVWHELYGMIIEEEEPAFSNKNINKFIGKLEMCANGVGFDIADYIKIKKDLLLFADIFEEGIKRYKTGMQGRLPDYFEVTLNNFVKEIRDYAHSLPE